MDGTGPYGRYYAERAAAGRRTVLWPWVLLALVVPAVPAAAFVHGDDRAEATAVHRPAPVPVRVAVEGVYRAGLDLVPGTWSTDGPGPGRECGYTRSGADGTEVSRGVLHGPAAARILDGESVVFTGACTWSVA
ncbi:hypothetical protein [Pseudonocardia sp. ICBG1293]|uniref:hypothetical protein n=1 Tax=Pseudonocardia sp. ICBG1293 TaxID=2844382 RepID=UPI001CCC0F91|nr:hypothetical protein [Pseudonocardia sp. ICBG1293]